MNTPPANGPRLVFLFSGHMVDAPTRKEPRFPQAKAPAADRAIRAALAEAGAGAGDLAICGGACGGDLLFAQASLDRGLAVEIHLPSDEGTFLADSVDHGGPVWRERFFQVKSHPRVRMLLLPGIIGPPAPGESKHVRNNIWMLASAMAWGPERVRFLCLWDRKGGDGPGGTQQMHDSVVSKGGLARVIDMTQLNQEEKT